MFRPSPVALAAEAARVRARIEIDRYDFIVWQCLNLKSWGALLLGDWHEIGSCRYKTKSFFPSELPRHRDSESDGEYWTSLVGVEDGSIGLSYNPHFPLQVLRLSLLAAVISFVYDMSFVFWLIITQTSQRPTPWRSEAILSGRMGTNSWAT